MSDLITAIALRFEVKLLHHQFITAAIFFRAREVFLRRRRRQLLQSADNRLRRYRGGNEETLNQT